MKKPPMRKNHTPDGERINKLVEQFLAIERDPKVHERSTTTGEGVTIAGTGDDMRIEYSLTKREVKILQILHEVTGVPVSWFAGDSLGWLRSYIDDLVTEYMGQLDDLIEVSPVEKSHEQRTRLFLERVQQGFMERARAA